MTPEQIKAAVATKRNLMGYAELTRAERKALAAADALLIEVAEKVAEAEHAYVTNTPGGAELVPRKLPKEYAWAKVALVQVDHEQTDNTENRNDR